MTKTQIKHAAQSALMTAMQAEFTRMDELGEPQEVIDEMSVQWVRVQKLFGYEPGSWIEGI